MAGQLGWSPAQFWAATYAELHFMYKGWLKSQGIQTDPAVTADDYKKLMEKFPDE
ncbi:phage tail assembly chaperone [Paremcibacter congregatus]|uniref:phage tail assembly chaperone n=1 Tax=Paremcibacter congregatus TaxID=2043170 RepID=UPI003C6E2E43|tara:strand:- start:3325 stop:3489 length:165 start_codon:yes stop_codon:yes gene_type:complete